MPTSGKKNIKLYKLTDGKAPFRDWLTSLKDADARQRINARITRLRTGNMGDCKSVGEGVSELRIDYGPGYRVYLGQRGFELIILLCAGDKSTQQTDIKLAKQYWQDYKKRVKTDE